MNLRIGGFGDFVNKQIGPFNSSVVVFFGPNESGKSTILNYIRTILFGFPLRKKNEHYPPMETGRHGGRIVINDGQGNDFTVERYADQKKVSFRDMSGTNLPEEKLEQSPAYKILSDLSASDPICRELITEIMEEERKVMYNKVRPNIHKNISKAIKRLIKKD